MNAIIGVLRILVFVCGRFIGRMGLGGAREVSEVGIGVLGEEVALEGDGIGDGDIWGHYFADVPLSIELISPL